MISEFKRVDLFLKEASWLSAADTCAVPAIEPIAVIDNAVPTIWFSIALPLFSPPPNAPISREGPAK